MEDRNTNLSETLENWPSLTDVERRDLLRETAETSGPAGDRQRQSLSEHYQRADEKQKVEILKMLAALGDRASLALFADLFRAAAPGDSQAASVAMAPLFQQRNLPADALFPRLLDCLGDRTAAPLVLDLANYVYRQKLAPRHPAEPRARELADLFAGIVQRLAQIEENPRQFADDPAKLRETVEGGIALAIALADALALIGDESVVGKLNQGLELGHRRLRNEVAAALARLGDKRGGEMLAQLAGDPASRTRALAYLDEVDQLDKAKPEDRTPAARAAARLADWLAQPNQFGAPPHRVELIDERTQFWPGYSEPVQCWLFSFEYQLHDGEFSSVGIVGPLTYSLAADLEDLSPDDIYAVFAGWQAEHEDIQETAAGELPANIRERLQGELKKRAGDEYQRVRLATAGRFFGEPILIGTATRNGAAGVVIADERGVEWRPSGTSQRAVGPAEAYWLHKGRKLLKAFNSPAPPPESQHAHDDSA